MNASTRKPNRKPSKRLSKEAKLTNETPAQNDIYARVTNKILADLEKGNLTWRKPWN